jgi:ribosomal protein L12E/L44/L45/RPP1/RPP2
VAECVVAAATQTSSTANLLELNFMDDEITARRQLEILEQRLSTADTSNILRGKFASSIKSVDDLLNALSSSAPPPIPPATATAATAATAADAATADADEIITVAETYPSPAVSIAPSTTSTTTSTTTLTPSLDATSLGE